MHSKKTMMIQPLIKYYKRGMRQKGKGIGSQKEETGKRGERVRKVRGKH